MNHRKLQAAIAVMAAHEKIEVASLDPTLHSYTRRLPAGHRCFRYSPVLHQQRIAKGAPHAAPLRIWHGKLQCASIRSYRTQCPRIRPVRIEGLTIESSRINNQRPSAAV